MHSLKGTHTAQSSLYLQNGSLTQVASADGYLCSRHKGGNDMVIAIHTDYFLGYIRVILHILAVCREMHGQFVAVDLRLEV